MTAVDSAGALVQRTLPSVVVLLLTGLPAWAQNFSVPTHLTAGGGGTTAGGTYSVAGTIGQVADMRLLSIGGTYSIGGGFWLTTDAVKVAVPFIDPLLIPGSSSIRAVHIMELRQRVDALRARFGLGSYAWSDALLAAGATPLRAVHFADLRTALTQVYVSAGTMPPVFTTNVSVGAPVTASSIIELRNAVLAIE